jgi:chromosome segregation protein
MTRRGEGAGAEGAGAEGAGAGDEVERERAIVEETVGQMEADERRLLADVVALRSDRVDLERELGEARDRLDALDGAVHSQELGVLVTERELQGARDALEQQREAAGEIEREITVHKSQLADARRRLEGLVEDVVRIQHKLRRAARELRRTDHG